MPDNINPPVTDLVQRVLSIASQETVIPCAIDRRWPFNEQSIIDNSNELVNEGLKFSGLQLVHAIASKYSGVSGQQPEVSLIKHSHYFDHLDMSGRILRIKKMPAGDFKSDFCHAIGVGLCCLVATLKFSIKLDQFAPIPGRGKRFDFRGVSNGVNLIFEARALLIKVLNCPN